MAWTTAERDSLKSAIARGEKSVTYGDRQTTYRSLDEMTQALAMIESELASTSSDPRPRMWLLTGSKGA